jgi:anaerobic magnesium-protoporphyrin IX monomethyl ester cyclase
LNVLLINPPWTRREQDVRKKLKVESCLPSLGLSYIAAVLQKNQMPVQILDANAEGFDFNAIENYLRKLQQVPDYIGVTAITTEISIVFEIANICKTIFKNSKIVLGGVHPTVMPEETLKNENVDFVIRGEGEFSFLELIQGNKIENIKGLSYKKNNKTVHNESSDRIKNLDDLPFPAFNLLPMSNYHPPLGLYKRLPATNIITARGCPNICTYCATQTIWGRRLFFRSVDNIIEEIKLLVKDFGIKEISISDDTFTISKERVMEFCNKLITNKIDLTWSCNSRVEKIDEESLRLMKKAGCHHICYGIESADKEILKNINKNINLDKARELIRLTKKAGITCRASFMFGNPGEIAESMKKTLQFAISSNPDYAVFNITTPYPGTPMYKWAKENGYLMDENWETYHGSATHIKLPTIEPGEIEKFQQYAFRKFYFRLRYIIARIFKIRTKYDIQIYVQAFKSLLKL